VRPRVAVGAQFFAEPRGTPVVQCFDGGVFCSKGKCMTTITRKLTSLIGITFVAMALGCASTAKQEGTGEYVDDTVITGKVKTAIFNEPSLKSAEINVETFKGTVQLSGFVSSAANQSTAVQVARNVGGVKSVKNDMRLK
jgi:osmotically-inducible protein OsmY